MDFDYDVAIIGSGAGGFAAAIGARRQDARVVMIEEGTVGGTCVNVGCVPSKTLLAGAKAFHTARSHPFAGLPTQVGKVDLTALIAQKDELVSDMRQHKYLDLAESYGFEIIRGTAHFDSPHALRVQDRLINARFYIIATGANPAVPPLPGLVESGFLTSTTALELLEVPERLITIGGGFVGLEQSQLFARLGSKVTIIGRLAPRADPDLASRLHKILVEEGVTVINSRATSINWGQCSTFLGNRYRCAGKRSDIAVNESPPDPLINHLRKDESNSLNCRARKSIFTFAVKKTINV
jgi:mercuric reductase